MKHDRTMKAVAKVKKCLLDREAIKMHLSEKHAMCATERICDLMADDIEEIFTKQESQSVAGPEPHKRTPPPPPPPPTKPQHSSQQKRMREDLRVGGDLCDPHESTTESRGGGSSNKRRRRLTDFLNPTLNNDTAVVDVVSDSKLWVKLSTVESKLDKLEMMCTRKQRATTAGPPRSLKKEDTIQFEEHLKCFIDSKRKEAHDKASSRDERSFSDLFEVIDGSVLRCVSCVDDLAHCKLVRVNGKVHRSDYTSDATMLNKSAGRSTRCMVGKLSPSSKRAAKLETEHRQQFLKENIDSSWAAGIRLKHNTIDAVRGKKSIPNGSDLRKNFLRRCDTHLQSKEHVNSLRSQMRRDMLVARGKLALRNQLMTCHAGIKVGAAHRSHGAMCAVSRHMGVDTGDTRQDDCAAAVERCDLTSQVERALSAMSMRNVHPRTGTMTAFGLVCDFGKALRQSRRTLLLQKRVGTMIENRLTSLGLKHQDDPDFKNGYKMQAESNLCEVSKAFKLTGKHFELHYKGEAADGAIQMASTHLDGTKTALTNMNVADAVIKKIRVNRDAMHRVSSMFDHVWSGKTSECTQGVEPSMLQRVRNWFTGVTKKMADALNSKLHGGKDEALAKKMAEDIGVRFHVPRTSSSTRLHPHLALQMETTMANLDVAERMMTNDDVVRSTCFSKNAWRMHLMTHGIYKPLVGTYFLVQNQNSSSHCHLGPLRRIRAALLRVSRCTDIEEFSHGHNILRVHAAHSFDMTQGSMFGVNLLDRGQRTYLDEDNNVRTEDLTTPKTVQFVAMLAKMMAKELKLHLDNEVPRVVSVSKELFFLCAVEMACGRRQHADTEWELEDAGMSLSRGMNMVSKLFEDALHVTPPGLENHSEPLFIQDTMKFRNNVKNLLLQRDGKWLKQWFRVFRHRGKNHSRHMNVVLEPLRLDTTEMVLVRMTKNNDPCVDEWEHFTLEFAHASASADDEKENLSVEVVLLEDEVTKTAHDETAPVVAPKRFLAVHDTSERVGGNNEAMAETMFSQIALVVGNNRPCKEDGSLFETRCKVLANTPSMGCSKELFERVAEVGARGLPGFEVERQPLPILAVKRDKDEKNVGELGEVFKKHLQKPISHKQILATTTKMNAEHEKFLADEAKVDVTNNEAWKAAGHPMNAEGDDEPQRREVSHRDPEFEHLAENAFRSSRSGRTVHVPGMYARGGRNLARS